MSVLLFTIFTAICVGLPFLIRFFFKQYKFRKLINKIPGPDGHFIFGSALEFLRCPGDQRLQFIAEHFKKNGDVFRYWFGFEAAIIIKNAEDAQVILSSTVNINKSKVYEFLHNWLGTGLLTSTGEKWAKRRKLLTPAFHFSTLNSYFETIVENAYIFLEKLKAEESSKEFDMYTYANNCSLDTICETVMGVKVNAQEETSEYVSAIKELSKIFIKRLYSPWLHMNWIYSFSSLFKKEQKILKTVHGFTTNVIEQKKKDREERKINLQKEIEDEEKPQKNKPFLELLLDSLEEQGETFSNTDLREEVDTFMFEGHDSVSSATSWTIFSIASHIHIQENLFQEMQSIFGDSKRRPTMNDIRQMNYLDMVVKEALRLHPPAPVINRKLTEDVILGGHSVPAGAVVEVHIHQIHRNAKYYEKPNEFYPLHFTPEKCSTRHPFAFIPFSAGPRNCIGQKFANLEVKVLLSSLIRTYKIEALQEFDKIAQVPDVVLRPGNGLRIRITRRHIY